MLQVTEPVTLPQYSVGKVAGVWAAAAVPMGVLGWVFNPLLDGPVDAATGIHGSARLILLTIGLAWQFVLVLLLVRREVPRLSWPALRDRLRLGLPRHPRTGEPDARLLLWLALLMPLFALSVFLLEPPVNHTWARIFPFLAERPEFAIGQLFAPAARPSLEGAWWFYATFLLMGLFNTVIGEEMLFRGVLLPRMHDACGRWDWVVNGVIFGAYHLHQPWGIPGSAINGVLLFALPAKRFRSTWVSIAVHSTQVVYFGVILLPILLGRA